MSAPRMGAAEGGRCRPNGDEGGVPRRKILSARADQTALSCWGRAVEPQGVET
jgi:hypothetical protein